MGMEEMAVSIEKLAEQLQGRVVGNGTRRVCRVGTPEEHDSQAVVPLWASPEDLLSHKNPVLLTREDLLPPGFDAILVENPRKSLIPLLEAFQIASPSRKGVHPSAWVDPRAVIHPEAWIGPQCVVEEDAMVEEGAVLVAQIYVGARSRIGKNSRIEPQVVLYSDVVLEEDVTVHSGTILGADGFGYEPQEEEPPLKIPQIGGVRIEGGVEIGANVTVDRGTIGTTRIGAYSKLDDHVHVGHNCVVGKRCLLVAFVGLAGSAVLEDDVILAAKSGVAQHVCVGKGSQIAACGGATKDVPPGTVVSGFPAWEHRKELAALSYLRKMPDMAKKIKRMEKDLERLKERFPS
ncbi:MAG TPA: UDP-3-O-(3-hydroxymyristoyl)glucosamine N-acyltransferase [Synergistaceae bacterium]|nr:UDP-3-O-(3-hydroxymyristoyl)glucosamine N-acyltransferase [Synergistaceae bacterium]HPQ37046.1 UDP-3-O-(3-hydroxymyristoyl)glucosamine N-acyltransferase [Synergistaceae bacterium]